MCVKCSLGRCKSSNTRDDMLLHQRVDGTDGHWVAASGHIRVGLVTSRGKEDALHRIHGYICLQKGHSSEASEVSGSCR